MKPLKSPPNHRPFGGHWSRRTVLHGVGAAAVGALGAWSGVAHAQPGRDRVLRMVVPFPPGGGSDVLARLIQAKLAEALKTSIVIENRPGAGGTLGADLVAKAPPDGSVMLLTDSSIATIAPALYPKLPYSAKSLAPVTSLAQFANVLVAPSRLTANTLAELVAQQRAHPTALTIASSGNGAVPHLTAELLKSATGLPITHVPFRGTGPAINDLAGGQVDLMFTGYATVAQLIKAGRLKAIAVSGPRRLPELPQVPTVAESGYPGFESWIAQVVFVPGGTPPDAIERLHAAIVGMLKQPDIVERMKQLGLEPLGSSPAELATWIDGQSRKWGKVIRDAGITAD